jgi:hypothetical protein
MGYAGYVPAKYASKLTPEQQALKAVSNEASYELMAKLVRNVVSCSDFVNAATCKVCMHVVVMRVSQPSLGEACKATCHCSPCDRRW